MADDLIRRGHTEEGHREEPCDNGVRAWRAMATSQGSQEFPGAIRK